MRLRRHIVQYLKPALRTVTDKVETDKNRKKTFTYTFTCLSETAEIFTEPCKRIKQICM